MICLHHEYLMAPFLELSTDRLTLQYDMMCDHDVLTATFDSPVLNDLTMWPKTIDPRKIHQDTQQEVNRIKREANNQILKFSLSQYLKGL